MLNEKKQNKTMTLYGSLLRKNGLTDNYFSFIFVSQDDLMRLHNTADIGSDDENGKSAYLLMRREQIKHFLPLTQTVISIIMPQLNCVLRLYELSRSISILKSRDLSVAQLLRRYFAPPSEECMKWR